LKALFRKLRNGNSARFEEEVQDLIDQGAEQGVITPGEGEMIQSIFELGETLAREIMVPRTSVVAAPSNAPIGRILDLSVSSGHSRLPIYEDDIDHIVGVLHVKDLLPHWGVSSEEALPSDIVRQVIFVPESKKVVDLLAELRSQKSHMAVVLDEYGGTAGLVTMEDIIEEIIGDIHDEYDVEEEPITRIDQQTILVDARLDIEDLEDYLDIKLPEGEYETVGGLITDLIGRVPTEKETVAVENLVMTIRSADERKINQVEIKLPAPPEERQTGSA
jgi:magnesium and cobalt transporter